MPPSRNAGVRFPCWVPGQANCIDMTIMVCTGGDGRQLQPSDASGLQRLLIPCPSRNAARYLAGFRYELAMEQRRRQV